MQRVNEQTHDFILNRHSVILFTLHSQPFLFISLCAIKVTTCFQSLYTLFQGFLKNNTAFIFFFSVLRLKMMLRLKVLQLLYHNWYLPPQSSKRNFIVMGFGLCTATPKRQIAGDNPLKFLTALFNTMKAQNLSVLRKTSDKGTRFRRGKVSICRSYEI